MKVYVVEVGAYSDKRIIGVSLSKEDAQMYVKVYEGTHSFENDPVEVLEFDTDDFPKWNAQTLKKIHAFVFNKKGEIVKKECFSVNNDYSLKSFKNRYGDDYYVEIDDDNEERAIKKARDTRAAYYAREYGL